VCVEGELHSREYEINAAKNSRIPKHYPQSARTRSQRAAFRCGFRRSVIRGCGKVISGCRNRRPAPYGGMKEMAALRSAFDVVAAGASLGKTTLVEAFLTDLPTRLAEVASGEGFVARITMDE
jgi:hypothetical protein